MSKGIFALIDRIVAPTTRDLLPNRNQSCVFSSGPGIFNSAPRVPYCLIPSSPFLSLSVPSYSMANMSARCRPIVNTHRSKPDHTARMLVEVSLAPVGKNQKNFPQKYLV